MKEIMVQENDAMFEEILEHCQDNMDNSSWEYSSNNQSRQLQCLLIGKKTGHHVGWLVYREWEDDTYETHISIKEDILHELLKQDRW